MIIKQNNEDGSAVIIFDENEKNIIKENGELFFDEVSFKHLTNELMNVLVSFQTNFKGGVKNLMTYPDTKIEGKKKEDV